MRIAIHQWMKHLLIYCFIQLHLDSSLLQYRLEFLIIIKSMCLWVWLFCLNMWNKINWLRIDNGLTWQGQVRYAIGQNLNKFWFFFANSYVTFELKCTNNVKERIEAKENQSKFCFTVVKSFIFLYQWNQRSNSAFESIASWR